MKTGRGPKRESGASLSPADYPTLESFFSGYLHQDFVVTHGTPDAALRAFRADASKEEQRSFEREAATLLEAAASLPFDVVTEFIHRGLGAAWRPTDPRELESLLRAQPVRRRR